MGQPAQRRREDKNAAVAHEGNKGAGFARSDARRVPGAAEEDGHDRRKAYPHESIAEKAEDRPRRNQHYDHAAEGKPGPGQHQGEVAKGTAQAVAHHAPYDHRGAERTEHEGRGELAGPFDREKEQASPFGHRTFGGIGHGGKDAAEQNKEGDMARRRLFLTLFLRLVRLGMGHGKGIEAEIQAEDADEVDQGRSAKPGKKSACQRTQNAADAVAGVHHGNAGAEKGAFYLYGLRIHGHVHKAHRKADSDARKPKLERRGGKPGQRQGKAEKGREKEQDGTAGEPVDEPCAGGKGNHARHAEAEKDEADLRLVGPCLYGKGRHTGREHTVDEPRPSEEVRASRPRLGEGGTFHSAIPPNISFPDFYLCEPGGQAKSLTPSA